MGSLLSGGTKGMVTPRSLEELAKSVELAEGSSVEQSIQGSVWGGSFTSRLTDKELQQLFTFLVLVSALERSTQQRVRLLREVKQRVFSDSRAWIPAISFRDPDKRVEEVFTIFERLDLTREEEEEKVGLHTQAERSIDIRRLCSLLQGLAQDRTIRNDLEPVFRAWVKKPGVTVQQCLLSLL